MTANVSGQKLNGYLFDIGEQRDHTRTQYVQQNIAKVKTAKLELLGLPEIIREKVQVPVAGTFSILAEAWQRFGHLPWESMVALQSLYDGSWSESGGEGAFEPEEPIIPTPVRNGHPPVTPLDRAAPPTVLQGTFSDPVCRDIYTLIWERFNFAESVGDAGLPMTRIRVDFKFSEVQRLGVRFEGAGSEGVTPEQLRLLEQSVPENGASFLQYHFSEIPQAALIFEAESAGRWIMSMEQLLLEMERMNIGRPSTCASALEALVKKRLLEAPVHKGQLRLTASGLKTALALESSESELSSPQFCTQLGHLLDGVERGDLQVHDAFRELLPLLIPHETDLSTVQENVWNSLESLELFQRNRSPHRKGGGLITSPSVADQA